MCQSGNTNKFEGEFYSPFEGGWGDDHQIFKNADIMDKSNLYYNKKLKELARRLRKESTKAEIKLWKELLRGGQIYGYKFLRQRPVFHYIVDFMCKDLKLVIEVDRFTHEWEEQWKLDQKRQYKLEQLGFEVLRFTDEEILKDISNVERVIEEWVIDHPPAPPSAKGIHLGKGGYIFF